MHVLIGKTGSSVDVDRCTFKGDLKDDGHYIVEKILGDKSNALKIRSCKFSDDMKKSLDLDKKHETWCLTSLMIKRKSHFHGNFWHQLLFLFFQFCFF